MTFNSNKDAEAVNALLNYLLRRTPSPGYGVPSTTDAENAAKHLADAAHRKLQAGIDRVAVGDRWPSTSFTDRTQSALALVVDAATLAADLLAHWPEPCSDNVFDCAPHAWQHPDRECPRARAAELLEYAAAVAVHPQVGGR